MQTSVCMWKAVSTTETERYSSVLSWQRWSWRNRRVDNYWAGVALWYEQGEQSSLVICIKSLAEKNQGFQ